MQRRLRGAAAALLLAACALAAPAGAQAPDPGGDEGVRVANPAPGKGFGFNLGVLAPGDATPAPAIGALRRLGATHFRFPVTWRLGGATSSPQDPIPGPWKLPFGASVGEVERWDATYAALVDAGIVPVLILYDVPRWASTKHRCLDRAYALANGGACPLGWELGLHLPDGAFFEPWRAWARLVAERYPLAVLEGPNEPDLDWQAGRPWGVPPVHAAAVQCALHEAVPASRVLLSPGMFSPGYVREYLQAAGRRCHDALSLHPYAPDAALGAGSAFARDLELVRAARRDVGDRAAMWITETGPAMAVGDEALRTSVTRRLYDRLAAMDDVAVVLFHTLRDPAALGDARFGFFDSGWRPKARACSFSVAGSPAAGPCPAVPAAARGASAAERFRAAFRRKTVRRCRTVRRTVRRDGRRVVRKVRTCRRVPVDSSGRRSL